MVLPEPVWSDVDIREVKRNRYNPISNTWSKDPTKLAILWALYSCQAKLGRGGFDFRLYIVDALAQKTVCFLHSYSLEVEGGQQ